MAEAIGSIGIAFGGPTAIAQLGVGSNAQFGASVANSPVGVAPAPSFTVDISDAAKTALAAESGFDATNSVVTVINNGTITINDNSEVTNPPPPALSIDIGTLLLDLNLSNPGSFLPGNAFRIEDQLLSALLAAILLNQLNRSNAVII